MCPYSLKLEFVSFESIIAKWVYIQFESNMAECACTFSLKPESVGFESHMAECAYTFSLKPELLRQNRINT